MKLILVKHGEAQENTYGIVQGCINSVLNKTEKYQAKAVASNFNESLSVIYSSDLKRCIQTADI